MVKTQWNYAWVFFVLLIFQPSAAQYRFHLSNDNGLKDNKKISISCQDKWLGTDKFQHGIAVFQISFLIYQFNTRSFDINKRKALYISAISGISLSLLKELWDYHQKDNHFCLKDLTADAVGLLGMVLMKET